MAEVYRADCKASWHAGDHKKGQLHPQRLRHLDWRQLTIPLVLWRHAELSVSELRQSVAASCSDLQSLRP